MELQFLLRSSLKVIKDSTTPKHSGYLSGVNDGLKVIKDSTTPKQVINSFSCKECLKVIKDSTTPKLKWHFYLFS